MTGQAERSASRSSWLPLAFITLVYTLTHAVSLLNRGIYWDDWVFWKQDMDVVSEAATAMGSTWPASINRLFYYSQTGIFLDRAVTFLALLLTALLFYDILRRLPGVSQTTAMWTAVLFGVFPVYESRIALVLVGYALSVFLFTAAVWVLVRTAGRSTIPFRVLSGVLFLLAFHTGSLLVLFGVVPIVLLMVDPPEAPTLGSSVKRLAAYADQLMLPVLYWVVTRIWFQPFGRYAMYNTPGSGREPFTSSLFYALVNIGRGPFEKAYQALSFGLPLAVAILVAVLVLWGAHRWPQDAEQRSLRLFLIGFGLLVLGILPYVIVGKIPHNYDWETRHQLLVPFGGALLMIAVVQGVYGSSRIRRVAGAGLLSLMLATSVLVHVDSYVGYERDWLKQQALMVEFGQSEAVRDARFILVDDATHDLDRSRRQYYEYTGMLAEVFHDQKRFAIFAPFYGGNYERISQVWAREPYYKLGEFEGGRPDLLLKVGRGDLDVRQTPVVLRLMVLEWTDPEAFREQIDRVLVLDPVDYPAEP